MVHPEAWRPGLEEETYATKLFSVNNYTLWNTRSHTDYAFARTHTHLKEGDKEMPTEPEERSLLAIHLIDD